MFVANDECIVLKLWKSIDQVWRRNRTQYLRLDVIMVEHTVNNPWEGGGDSVWEVFLTHHMMVGGSGSFTKVEANFTSC